MGVCSRGFERSLGILLPTLFLFCACGAPKDLQSAAQLQDVTGGQKPLPIDPVALEYPGLIPLDPNRRTPATDLVYQNKVISPEEASKLRSKGVDLAGLNPNAETDLWKDVVGAPTRESDDELSLNAASPVDFQGFISALTGRSRFTIRQEVAGTFKSFTVVLGRNAHDYLLRKAFLRKLGYVIAPTVHLPKLTLQFNNTREREIFLTRVAKDAMADTARWVTAQPNEKTLILQDVVAFDSKLDIYNLAAGVMPASGVQGRRLMRSLIVPYSLVSMGENVNMFSWVAGRIFDNHVVLGYENGDNFDTSYDDAAWIMRRIIRLTRNDFTEIVAAGVFPTEVQALLVEKLIARRNSLAQLLKINSTPIDFNAKLTMGNKLINGEVVGEVWPGYAERFSYGDPESPLSGKEIEAFAKSKGIANLISNAVNFLNRNVLEFDLGSALAKHKYNQFIGQLEQFVKTGEVTEIPLGIHVIPVLGSSLILNRDVVLGSYMGSEQKVSLADSIGFNINTGAYFGVDGLPEGVNVSGNTQAFIRRTYTHLKPITSFQVALKSPFQNILIPLYQQDIASKLSELTEENLAKLNAADRQKKISAVIGIFRENLAVGESVIVTDSVGGDISVQVGKNFFDSVAVSMGVGASHVMISRFNIQRVSDDSMIVSDGRGNISSFRFTASLSSNGMPILHLGVSISEGKAVTEVVPLNITADERRNPDIVRVVGALRNAFQEATITSARKLVPGYRFYHEFKATKTTLSFLFYRYAQIYGAMTVKVEDIRSKATKTFYQRHLAEREGTDFQGFALDGINAVLAKFFSADFALRSEGGTDPAGTVGGKSFLRELVYEGVVEPAIWNSDLLSIREGHFAINYRWRGWSMGRQELDGIVNAMNTKYQFPFFAEGVLGNTQALQFYDIQLRSILSAEGFRAMLRHSRDEYVEVFTPYLRNRSEARDCTLNDNVHRDEYCQAFSQFLWFLGRYAGAWADGDIAKASGHLINAMAAVENRLSAKDFQWMLGGTPNLFVSARMDGFRSGDENGDIGIVGSTFGRLGTGTPSGSLSALAGRLSIPAAEVLATWIRETL